MNLRTNNFTVCILINTALAVVFDLCLSRQNMTFSILPPSKGFQIDFALLELTTRAYYTCVAVLHFTNLNPDFAPGSFRLVSESRFRFLFHSTTLLFNRNLECTRSSGDR